jgi:hypothetical protein
MNDNKELLTSVLHTVQMGQSGIRAVEHNAVRTDLKQELKDQLQEYDSIEKEALRLAQARGWKLSNVNPLVTQMSRMMAKVQLMVGDADSKIAGMLIQGNTRGIILGVKNLNRDKHSDTQVTQLAQRLLNRENINIQKSQPFL